MEELIKELKIALDNKLYITAINTALIIPDICSALQSSNGRTNGKKYSNWFNEFVSEKYSENLYGSDVYKLRCASLHQGKFNYDYDNYDRILFQPTTINVIMHNCISANNGGITEKALILNIEIFINDIIVGHSNWLSKMKDNPFYEMNLKQSFKYNPLGVKPHVVGIPIIA
jgi:hypothetical protein